MKLTRLDLYGFKSFPQKTSICFNSGITGIVGPNGAGKSNISDAVRWVLGEQSAKALRGAKMEDVIFSGTQKRRLMPYCEVSLVFDNEDASLRSENTEVMVTRRAFRSGEGEYFLNRKSVRLKDIVELFRDTGFGREGYSVIGQGNIDTILSGRGEERRAAFEEAAGIVGFRARKEEAERKLERTRDNLSRVGDLIEELSGRLEPLKTQAEAARQYISLMERQKALDANIFLIRHERLSKRLEGLKENQGNLRALIKVQEEEIARCQSLRRENEEHMAISDQAADEAKEQQARQEGRLQDHLMQTERKQHALKTIRDELSRESDMAASASMEKRELETLAVTARGEARQNTALLTQADTRLADLETAYHEKEEALRLREEALEQNRARILQLINRHSDAREKKARQQAMQAQGETRLAELQQNHTALEENRERAERDLAHAEGELAKVRLMVSKLAKDKAELDKNLRAARDQAGKQNDAWQTARFALQRDEERLNALREVARGHEGYFQAVRKALEYAGKNTRVHGVIAQLISVPRELETAIEMVLGGAMQNIVTQDEEAAKDMIDYLREKRLGRTTFLPVSAVSGRRLTKEERNALSLSGCLGVASELISFKEEHRGVIESLLGRTVVARDLTSAIAISRAGRQAFHVVSLQGDVMRSGGAMTGGSSSAQTVSLLGRERKIKELDQSVEISKAQLEQLQRDALTANAKVRSAENLLADAEARVQNEEIGIAREEERVKTARESLKRIDDSLTQTGEAVAQVREMIAQLNEDLSSAKEQDSDIALNQAALQEDDTRLKGEVQTAREAADAARGKLEDERERRAHLAHQLDLFTRDQTRFEKEMAKLDAKNILAAGRIKTLAQTVEKEDACLKELLKQSDDLRKAAADAQNRTQEGEKERRELAARQKLLMDEAETAHRLHNEHSEKLHRVELSLTRLEEELQAMAAQLWNTYEMTYALADTMRFSERFDLNAGEAEAESVRQTIRDMGPINVHALEDYAATKARYDDLTLQRGDANQALLDLTNLIRHLQTEMERQFVREFEKLNQFFGETFQRLFSGGKASMVLSDPGEPLECEIQIKAQPPGKKLQLLSLLSGGERTLTAIAILFAMLKLKPTPFCILDEIEAALDDANISNFADYLSEYAQSTQFIVITHRKGTMERCDALYGVTMSEMGVSDMISVNLREYSA